MKGCCLNERKTDTVCVTKWPLSDCRHVAHSRRLHVKIALQLVCSFDFSLYLMLCTQRLRVLGLRVETLTPRSSTHSVPAVSVQPCARIT